MRLLSSRIDRSITIPPFDDPIRQSFSGSHHVGTRDLSTFQHKGVLVAAHSSIFFKGSPHLYRAGDIATQPDGHKSWTYNIMTNPPLDDQRADILTHSSAYPSLRALTDQSLL